MTNGLFKPWKPTLEELDIELEKCSSGQKALELVMTGQCSTLIVDFDMPGAEEVSAWPPVAAQPKAGPVSRC